MKYRVVLIGLLSMLAACSSPSATEEDNDYEIVLDGDIYVEQFDSTHTSDTRYTDNNQVYKAGLVFTYDYYYRNVEGETYKFQETEGAKEMEYQERKHAWEFVPLESMTDRTIEQIEIEVLPGLQPMVNFIPDYNQTVVLYDYVQVDGKKEFNSSSGIIENEKNIWAHPPRDRLLNILELNPFPFIQAPYEVGNTWNWSLQIGSSWGDERWKTWEGNIENRYVYEITGQKDVETALGLLNCFEVQSTATSSLGETHLTALFNPSYGFVKLDYINIDSSKLVLELVKVEQKDD